MTLNRGTLQYIVKAIAMTKNDEIGCDECFEEIDRFVELKLEGKSAEEAMPLIKDHLDRCGNCYEEYEALLDALKSIERSI